MSRCKSCGAEIWFIKTENGTTMAVNEQPVPFIPNKGKRTYVTEDGCVIRGQDWKRTEDGMYMLGYIPHKATCRGKR